MDTQAKSIKVKYRAHVIRISDPSSVQIGFFRRCVGTKRFVFNNGQRVWQDKYQAKEKTSSNIIRNYFVGKKKEAGLEWLGDVPKSVIQGAAEDLGNAYSRFFKKLGCYPKQKHRKDSEQSAVVNNDPSTIRLNGKSAHIPKLGWVKLREECRYKDCKYQSLVLKVKNNKWYLVVRAEIADLDGGDNQPIRDGSCDFGLTSDLTIGDATHCEKLVGPKPLRKGEKKLGKLQRQLAKKKRGSSGYYKKRYQVAKHHEKMANQRKDWQHKATSKIAKLFNRFYIENLNTKGMMKNHKLAKAISDVGWGELKRQLHYKLDTIEIDRYFPSSQLCSCCDHKQKLKLSDRIWECEKCHTLHDRDENAQTNILIEGRRVYAEIMEQGKVYGVYLFGMRRIKAFVDKNTARTAGIYASGDEGNAPDKESGEKPCVGETGTKLAVSSSRLGCDHAQL